MYSSINTGQVNCNGATRIVKQNTNRLQVQIVNTSTSADVYLGSDSTVTTANGHILPRANATVVNSITLSANSDIWGIPSTGTATVTYVETLF